MAGICNSVGGGFLPCHHDVSDSVKYWLVSKRGLLIDIQIATTRWPFLLCFKPGDVVHLSRCDMLPGLYGHTVCTTLCQSICPVPFTSRLITMHTSTTAAVANKLTDRTSIPRYKIALPLLRYSLKPWSQWTTQLNSSQLKWLSWVELCRVGRCDHAVKLFYLAGTPIGGDPHWNFVTIFGIRKQRVPELLYGVVYVIQSLAVLVQCCLVMDGRIDRQTRRQHIPH